MVMKKFTRSQDQMRDSSKKGWENTVIGERGDITLVGTKVRLKNGDMSAQRVGKTVNETGECCRWADQSRPSS